MTGNFLARDALPEFLDVLAAAGRVHGPVLSDDGVTIFGPVRTADDLQLNYRRTLLPPKKYLLPPRDTVLTYAPATGYRLADPCASSIVLLGLHPCDLQGLAYLDRVFLDERPDPAYRARRAALTVVGLSCEPDDSCFCSEPAAARNECDLFMHQTAGGFVLTGTTPGGEALLDQLKPLLTASEPLPEPKRPPGLAATLYAAAARHEQFAASPLWDAFAERCLGCGACSLCCPTCYCFDIREYGALDGMTAHRIRDWDNCLFCAHGAVAGGGNFRQTRQERFRYRYQHKYLGFGPTRGVVSCVGCGRCRAVCPVGIDLTELFRESADGK